MAGLGGGKKATATTTAATTTKKVGLGGKAVKGQPKTHKPAGGSPSILSLEGALKKAVGDAVLEPETIEDLKFAAMDLGTKNSGKSAKWATLPRPHDGYTVYISFDEATWEGLVNRYGEPFLRDNKVVCYEVTKPRINKATNEVIYPGFDANNPDSTRIVFGMVNRIIDKYAIEGADNIILDHWQGAHEELGAQYGRSMEGLNALEKIPGKKSYAVYGHRSDILRVLFKKAWRAARHAIIMTGYRDEEVSVEEEDGEGNTKRRTVLQEARWAKKYQAPFKVVVESWSTRDKTEARADGEAADTHYYMHVTGSKNPLFPEGQTFDLTGSSIRAFWDSEATLASLVDDLDPEGEEE